MLLRCWEFGREGSSGAGEYIKDQERQNGGEIQSSKRWDDSTEYVQVGITYCAKRVDNGWWRVGEPSKDQPNHEHCVVYIQEVVNAICHH